jgi:homoserine trans-succinylase
MEDFVNRKLKALYMHYVAQQEEALANLEATFNANYVDSFPQFTELVKSINEAKQGLNILVEYFDVDGKVVEQPDDNLFKLIVNDPETAETIFDDLEDEIERANDLSDDNFDKVITENNSQYFATEKDDGQA